EIIFGCVLIADALAAFGWLRDLPVIACVGVGRLERETIVDEHAKLDELPVPVYAVALDDPELFGMHPSIGAEPRLRVEPDGVDDEGIVAVEVPARIAVERERHVARVRRIQIDANEAVLVDGRPDLIELVARRFDEAEVTCAGAVALTEDAIELADLTGIVC